MNQPAELRLFDYRYFPYELELAKREILAFGGSAPARINGSFFARGLSLDASKRLTYFREVVISEGTRIIPLQALLEASDRNGRASGSKCRQHTRYSAHGIHEYRGKFNPQMVRAICNLTGASGGSRLWDPFCGSGTVLLEALHYGVSALGTDRNPLGILIANSKLAALAASPRHLAETGRRFVEELRDRGAELEGKDVGDSTMRRIVGKQWEVRLENSQYLAAWFPRPVLAQLQLALDIIRAGVPRRLQALFRILVSEVVREVSWQDPGDLRIRRRKDAAANYPALSRIAEHTQEQLRRITAAREHIGELSGWQRAVEADSRELASFPRAARRYLEEGVDLVLTSPPYATALPYVDTHRLSLALLGLSNPGRIRRLDSELLGSREIANRERRETEARIRDNVDHLPVNTIRLCRELLEAVDQRRDGFRRINTPALVYRYFNGMKKVMTHVASALRARGSFVLLVGPNRTALGGTDYIVDTPAMLAEIGDTVGLRLAEHIPLQAYHRFSLHQQNSIRKESLLVLRNRR